MLMETTMNTIGFRSIHAGIVLRAAEAHYDLCAMAMQAREDLGIELTPEHRASLDAAQEQVFDAEAKVFGMDEAFDVSRCALIERGYAVHYGAPEDPLTDTKLQGRWWWSLYRSGWSSVEASDGDWATERQAWADAARADADDTDDVEDAGNAYAYDAQ
jgi:hypothetical protein